MLPRVACEVKSDDIRGVIRMTERMKPLRGRACTEKKNVALA
jgi:hypothetical protein